MQKPFFRTAIVSASLALALFVSGCGSSMSSPTASNPAPSPFPTPTPLPTPPPTTGYTIAIVADIGWPGSVGTPKTAGIIEWLRPSVVLEPGDICYPDGTLANCAVAYDPFYGQFDFFVRPVPGNHEYGTPDARDFFTRFGSHAGPSGLGYYTFSQGNWLFLAFNSNVARGTTSPQVRNARAVLQANKLPCALGYWHYPRWTSGPSWTTATPASMQTVWDLLYEFGVELVFSGHDHNYERLKPLNAKGEPAADGIRQFISGTGGGPLYGFPNLQLDQRGEPTISEKRVSEYGVLFVELLDNGYRWWFFTAIAHRAEDEGVGTCR